MHPTLTISLKHLTTTRRTKMPKLDDERVEKKKSEYELNQEALMETLGALTKLVGELNTKIDTQYANFVKYARAGKF